MIEVLGRLLAYRLFLGALLLLAIGCSAQMSAPVDLETRKPGELLVGFRPDDKPASFLQDDGTPAGLYVDISREIAKRLGVTPSFVSADFASALPNVRNHLIDTTAMSVLVTPEREEVVKFTGSTGYLSALLVSRKANPLQTVADAGGKTVAITRGSALIELLQRQNPSITIKEFPNIAAETNALIAGQIDALFTGTVTTAQLTKDHPDLIAGKELVTSGMTALPVAPDRPKLLAAMNRALVDIMNDGTYAALHSAWYQEEPIAAKMFEDYPGVAKFFPTPTPAR